MYENLKVPNLVHCILSYGKLETTMISIVQTEL